MIVVTGRLSGTNNRERFCYVPIVVRDSVNQCADVLVQIPTNTMQAYNCWPGLQGRMRIQPGSSTSPPPYVAANYLRTSGAMETSLYLRPSMDLNLGLPAQVDADNVRIAPPQDFRQGAVAVRFDRPFDPLRACAFFQWAFNVVQFLEGNGYEVSYIASIDVHLADNSLILNRAKCFLSIGHDEYWSWEMRRNLQAAHETGMHIAFLGGNSMFWQVRLEAGVPGGQLTRLVCYKSIDPNDGLSQWQGSVLNDPIVTPRTTAMWRSVRVMAPEDALVGIGWILSKITGVESYLPRFSSQEHWIMHGTLSTSKFKLTILRNLMGYEPDEEIQIPDSDRKNYSDGLRGKHLPKQPPGGQSWPYLVERVPIANGTSTVRATMSMTAILAAPNGLSRNGASMTFAWGLGSMYFCWGLSGFRGQWQAESLALVNGQRRTFESSDAKQMMRNFIDVALTGRTCAPTF
jgi:hypothetical protein